LKAAWLGLKVRRQRVANKAVSALRSTRTTWLNSSLRRGSKQDPDFSSEWCFNQCVYRISDEILRAFAEMEALSLRSSNVQVNPRTSKERAFSANKAAGDREARVAIEQNIALPQPDWVIQPPPNEDTPLSSSVQAKPRTSKERAFAAQKAAADRELKLLKDKNFALPPPEWVIQPPQNGDILSETYKTGELLGKGGFALCYEGELQPRGDRPPKTYALKIVRAKMTQDKVADKVI